LPTSPVLAAALALLGVFALLAPAAAAEPMEAVLQARGAIRFDGDARALARDATLLLAPGGGDLVATFRVAEGTLRVVRSERVAVDAPFMGDAWLPPTYEDETLALDHARVVVRAPAQDFLGVLAPTGDGALGFALPRGLHALADQAEARHFVIGPQLAESYPYYFLRDVPAHSFRLAGGAEQGFPLVASGRIQLALTGAVLEIETSDGVRVVQLGDWDEAAGPTVAGQAATYRHRSAFAVLSLLEPLIDLASGARAELFTRAPALALQGRLVVEDAAGDVSAGTARATPRATTVELEGAFAIEVARVAGEPGAFGDRPDTTNVRVQGIADRAVVGGRSLLAFALPVGEGAAAPLAGLVAVAFAWLSGAGTKVLAMAVAPAYAPMGPQAVLANHRRGAIYDAVQRNPGIHMRELQRLMNMRWGSLQYHVSVLLAKNLLVSAQTGRRTLLACDVHGLDPAQLHALHLLRGTRARRVAAVLAPGAVVTQREIIDAARVSPRLTSRYLGIMGGLGLVEADSHGRPKRYVATPRMYDLLPRAAGTEPGMPPAR
jgi:hypothetical protein